MSVRHAILGLLTQAPMHGYQIGGELARRIAGGRYNSAQIYQSLHWLAGQGMVAAGPLEPGINRDRRPFLITAAGRREFQKWLRSPLVPSRPVRDDAVVKLAFLGMHDARQLLLVLERLRRQHLRRLTAPSRRIATSDATGVDEALLAELSAAALRFREEAELRWIDHCLLRLRMLLGAESATPAARAVSVGT